MGDGRRRFWIALALIAAFACAVRLVYLLTLAPPMGSLSDARWYSPVSANLAAGHGFVTYPGGPATALHPPLYPIWLAFWRELGVNGTTALRALSTLLGAVTTGLIGVVGRRLAGATVGLACAALVAVHPLFITADATLLAEPLYGVMIACVLLAAVALHERPAPLRAALLGVAIGLATLTRSEALLLTVVLVLPLVWANPVRLRWRLFASAAVCTGLVLTPWVIRNWSDLGRPLLSTNGGLIVAQTNNHATYYEAPSLGALGPYCPGWIPDEAKFSARCSRRGRRYALHHANRWPVVVPVRMLREWSMWRHPLEAGSSGTGRRPGVYKLGILFYYALLAVTIAGIPLLRRLGLPFRILLAPIVVVTVVGAATWGNVRLRAPGDLALTMLAGMSIVELARRFSSSRRERAPV